MSSLQERSRPFLAPLILGQWPQMSDWAVRSLAVWIIMFSMVYEFRDRKTMAISFDERDQFRRIRDPTMNWRIWIGRIDARQWRGKTVHIGTGLFNFESYQSKAYLLQDPPMNMQTTTAVFGKLLFHSYYVSPSLPRFKLNPFGNDLAMIWPPRDAKLAPSGWPARILRDEHAERVAVAIPNIIRALGPDIDLSRPSMDIRLPGDLA
ncbi:hypothetical protein [Bradyrhizobium symbiodeficiens]|uniref:Uncharacterized protein n=1 Tax=Bradyrhizobium symbiodeficiens TaxID=1404367 RepID=A0A6G9AAT4_9BRAD|nr:hypothetical protein [Bradyrhizobium symbiodeficiens]QIP09538.1 hypothetical protein HAV00_26275 [Bradyrhizobium symbiodeficiens]